MPHDVEACVFALDGVLVPSADLHIEAWTETFDELLLARAERTHAAVPPVRPAPRLQGAAPRPAPARRGARLSREPRDPAARGNRLGSARERDRQRPRQPEDRGPRSGFSTGTGSSPSRARTAISSSPTRRASGARSSPRARTRRSCSTARASPTSSTSSWTARRSAAITSGSSPRPTRCRRPAAGWRSSRAHAAAFETSRAGVVAAREAGCGLVVGVEGATGADTRDELRAAGADVVVGTIAELLERSLAA